jgi:hypothetical protein
MFSRTLRELWCFVDNLRQISALRAELKNLHVRLDLLGEQMRLVQPSRIAVVEEMLKSWLMLEALRKQRAGGATIPQKNLDAALARFNRAVKALDGKDSQ